MREDHPAGHSLGAIRHFSLGEFSAATSSDRLPHLPPYLHRLLDVAFGIRYSLLASLANRCKSQGC
jgi:hypothetical protein